VLISPAILPSHAGKAWFIYNPQQLKPMSAERLQKILARAGLGSRREMETWLSQGRVLVNQKPAQLGDKVTEQDEVKVDGHRLNLKPLFTQLPEVLCYHKPVGRVCTQQDPEGRPTVFEQLPKAKNGRWIAIGRLDLNTTGLLLFTTDGELANRLMHPSAEIEREYAVRVFGEVSDEVLRRLKTGVQLEDGEARFNRILDAGGTGLNHWYHVIIKEGRKREVRRLWESQEVKVSRLMRIRFGAVNLPKGLKAGYSVRLGAEDTKRLYAQAGLHLPAPPLAKPIKPRKHQRDFIKPRRRKVLSLPKKRQRQG